VVLGLGGALALDLSVRLDPLGVLAAHSDQALVAYYRVPLCILYICDGINKIKVNVCCVFIIGYLWVNWSEEVGAGIRNQEWNGLAQVQDRSGIRNHDEL
jgi:hypothetical protein